MLHYVNFNASKDDAVEYGSVRRGDRPGWAFSARIKGQIVTEDSGLVGPQSKA